MIEQLLVSIMTVTQLQAQDKVICSYVSNKRKEK